MIAEIEEAFAEGEYSRAATYDVDSINFIDTVNESSLKIQPISQIKMKFSEHVDYSFTDEDKQFLNTDKKEASGTCVIDNFIDIYGKELKLTREDFIKLHQEYYKNIFATSSDLDDGLEINEPWRLEDGIAPLFLEYVCKLYDIIKRKRKGKPI